MDSEKAKHIPIEKIKAGLVLKVFEVYLYMEVKRSEKWEWSVVPSLFVYSL